MNEYELAQQFYNEACRFADDNNAPRSAIAKAQFHSAVQLFVEQDGADKVAAWLKQESKVFRETLESYRGMLERGGRC